MTEVPKPTPENYSETVYRTITRLYGDLNVDEIPILDSRVKKTLTLQDGKSISIHKTQSEQGDPWFEVDIDGFGFRASLEESIPDGLLELGPLLINLQIGNFTFTKDAGNDVISVTQEKRGEVALALTNWAKESIKENRITNPPILTKLYSNPS